MWRMFLHRWLRSARRGHPLPPAQRRVEVAGRSAGNVVGDVAEAFHTPKAAALGGRKR